jgi:hypothetical protein
MTTFKYHLKQLYCEWLLAGNSETYWENKEAQYSTALPMDLDTVGTHLSKNYSQKI